jgi:hypothetical protein
MKKNKVLQFGFIIFGGLAVTMGIAHADLVETKFKVTGRYYDGSGNSKKLVKTRAFIQYDTNATILSQMKTIDCLVVAGKSDALSLWSESQSHLCVSTKGFVVTSEDAVIELFYRPTEFQLFGPSELKAITDMIAAGATVSGETEKDTGNAGALRAAVRNALGNATKTQTISLVGKTTFRLQGKGTEKVVIELEPVKTKILNQ